jgi:hypothetical protein
MPVSRWVAEGELQDTAAAGGSDVSGKLRVAKGGRIHQREHAPASKGTRKIVRRTGIERKPEGHIVGMARNGRDGLSKKAFA